MGPLDEHFAIGAVVGGRYRIESVLGQGGFGAVFVATQLNLDRRVALKAMLPESLDAAGLGRFRREAAIVQRLTHPNVVRLLDFGVAASAEPFLVFELLEGQTLEQAIRGGPLPVARVARVATQILKALMEAHALGVVHRDIKPANVFLCDFQGEPDFVKLLDFGIAKGREGGVLTEPGWLVGTPAYMAPEQVTGGPATFATDLYALGLTMEEALTGRPVWKGLSFLDIAREHASPAPVPHAPAAMASPLGPILHRATQKAPERRHPSASEMLTHLEAAMSFARGGPSPAPPGTAVPLLAYAPTSLGSMPLGVPQGGLPAVPPAPARAGKKGGGVPWAVFGAIGGGVLVLGGALLVVLSLGAGRGEDRSEPLASGSAPPAGSPAASGSAAPARPDWINLEVEGTPVEVQANGDGVLDVVGYCATKLFGAPAEICAADGATFRPLWRRPAGFDVRVGSLQRFLGATDRSVVSVDPGGVAHVLDAATGAEQGAVPLGAHADWLCAPVELPGKVWIRTRQRGLMLDVAARTATEAARPASCVLGATERPCTAPGLASLCPPLFEWVDRPDFTMSYARIEGGRGVVIGTKKKDRSFPMLLGFEPVFGQRPSKILWQRPLGSGDGLGALAEAHVNELSLVGGRVVAAYDHASGTARIMAADPATGQTLWEVTTPPFRHLTVTRTRVYVALAAMSRIDVRDAATGRLLGGFGQALR